MSREQDNFPQFLFVKFQLGCVELNFHTCQIPRCWMMERPSWWNAADQYLGKMPFRVDQCKMTGEMRADIGERSRNLLPPARGLKLKNAKNTSSLEEFPLSWNLWKYICLVINLFQSSPLKMVTNSWPEGGGRGLPDRKLLGFILRELIFYNLTEWPTNQMDRPIELTDSVDDWGVYRPSQPFGARGARISLSLMFPFPTQKSDGQKADWLVLQHVCSLRWIVLF